MARCLEDLEVDCPDADVVPVAEGEDVEARPAQSRPAVDDPRTRLRREFEMTGEEVGVEMRLDDVGDGEPIGACVLQVTGDVTLRIHDDGLP